MSNLAIYFRNCLKASTSIAAEIRTLQAFFLVVPV